MNQIICDIGTNFAVTWTHMMEIHLVHLYAYEELWINILYCCNVTMHNEAPSVARNKMASETSVSLHTFTNETFLDDLKKKKKKIEKTQSCEADEQKQTALA